MLNGIKSIIRGDGYYEFVTPDGMIIRMTDEELPYKNLIDETSEMVGETNPRTRLPRTGGKWEGVPGDGKWFSENSKVTSVTGGQPVEFTNGRPNFKPWSKGTLEFPKGALKGTQEDFDLVYDKIKELNWDHEIRGTKKYYLSANSYSELIMGFTVHRRIANVDLSQIKITLSDDLL